MIHNRLLIIFFVFWSSCCAMEKLNVNFANVTLEGMNNFARQHCPMQLTDNSYKSLKKRLMELRVSRKSHELIAMQFYAAELIKESRAIKNVLTLVNMRMQGIESPCLPHIAHITSTEYTEIPKSNCTFTVMIEG